MGLYTCISDSHTTFMVRKTSCWESKIPQGARVDNDSLSHFICFYHTVS